MSVEWIILSVLLAGVVFTAFAVLLSVAYLLMVRVTRVPGRRSRDRVGTYG